MNNSTFISLAACAALAACSSGGDGSDPIDFDSGSVSSIGLLEMEDLPGPEARAQLSAGFRSALSDFETLNETGVRTTDMRTSGFGEFSGTFAAGVSSDDGTTTMNGDSYIRTDFAANSVSGRLDNFSAQDESGDAVGVTGVLDLSGAITGSDLAGTIGGTLDVEGTPAVVTSTMDGVFAGSGATGVVGAFDGSVDYDGERLGMGGVFSATRD